MIRIIVAQLPFYVSKMERNDQLTMELLKMLNSQLSAMEQSEAAARERERIRAVVNHIADRVSLEQFSYPGVDGCSRGFTAVTPSAFIDQCRVGCGSSYFCHFLCGL
jgi:hypothetical protein